MDGIAEEKTFEEWLTELKDINPQKLFNYLLQNLETSTNVLIVWDIIKLLKNKKTKIVLYTYDSILLDYHNDDNVLELIKEVFKKYNLKIILSLTPYFKNKSIIKSAVYAGITVVIALLINMTLSKSILNFYLPNNLNNLVKFLCIAFPLGYTIDVLIERLKIFGNSLDTYYKVAGSGLSYSFEVVSVYS